MSFRVMLPLDRARELPTAAADGQFGCVLKLYREWRLSGDTEWLSRAVAGVPPHTRVRVDRGRLDGDEDGVAEGAQHNTMDVEYYGPTPVIQGWYLAALQAGAAMARAVGDEPFATRCAAVLQAGRAGTEELLWNGAWYRQVIMPPEDFDRIAPALRHPGLGADDPRPTRSTRSATGASSTSSWATPTPGSPAWIRSSTRSGQRSRWTASIAITSSPTSAPGPTDATYGGRGEAGTWSSPIRTACPATRCRTGRRCGRGSSTCTRSVSCRPAAPGPQAAGHPGAVRRQPAQPVRRDQCGHHYARPLASWGLIVAATGFHYDGAAGRMRFAAPAEPVTWFWSTGHAWGAIRLDPSASPQVLLTVTEGRLRLASLVVGGKEVHREAGGSTLDRASSCLRDRRTRESGGLSARRRRTPWQPSASSRSPRCIRTASRRSRRSTSMSPRVSSWSSSARRGVARPRS